MIIFFNTQIIIKIYMQIFNIHYSLNKIDGKKTF